MKSILKYILISVILFGIIPSASAQFGKQKKADALYNSFSFVKAIEVYKEMLANNYNTDYSKRRLADSYAMLRDPENASVYYKDVVKQDKVEPEYYLNYALALRALKKYDESEIWLNKYKESGVVDSRIEKIMQDKNFLTNIFQIKPQFFSKEVPFNSELSDFGAFERNSVITFASSRDKGVGIKRTYSWNQQPFLDLFQITKNGDNHSEAEKVKGDVNTKFHEGQISISKDGKTMFFTRNNYTNNKKGKDAEGTNNLKIYRATLDKDNKWTNITEVPFNNTNYSVGHPSLSVDEKTLYFASDMPGGFGKSDIYKVSVNDNSYGTPVNLGNKINTEGSEVFPFVHSDGNLFFSSDGLQGLGQLDIFTTVLDGDGNIQEIINLGSPVNSNMDDFSFFLNESGETGFIASNREGGKGDDDIYGFDRIPPFEIKGTVTDAINKQPIPNAKIVIKDKDGNIIADFITDEKGKYKFAADRETTYNLEASQVKYNSKSKVGDTRNTKGKPHIIVDFELDPVQDVDILAGVNVDNIYFDFDKQNIRDDAAIELDKIAYLMNTTYPTMAVEIESHTDSRGSFTYNEALAIRRANSTHDYLISKGVNSNRIKKFEGFGEYSLVNDCKDGIDCSESAHQLNRRSIFKVLKMK
ncbi:WD40-like Beta Propeller Repeat [Flavobacterium swingsii]|uniref:WD40-like Beta Propeller Repeat n=1 Tax=Flavobacterium swingsii TaxID=498292 RepID=A0A1I0WZK4_9FLAO|nr:OmpA family protein [Flavobacterium swingsii]SFA93568.1 WD40-like Beta Propeller Repeat [Flavobacterium swingsii]